MHKSFKVVNRIQLALLGGSLEDPKCKRNPDRDVVGLQRGVKTIRKWMEAILVMLC